MRQGGIEREMRLILFRVKNDSMVLSFEESFKHVLYSYLNIYCYLHYLTAKNAKAHLTTAH